MCIGIGLNMIMPEYLKFEIFETEKSKYHK